MNNFNLNIIIKRSVFIVIFCLFNILLSQNKQIPIFAFHGVPPGEFSTKEQFLKMKKAGINICYTVFYSKEDILKALQASQAAGTKLVIGIKLLEENTEEIVNLVKEHPALYGYSLVDEPSPSQFPVLKDLVQRIKRYDTKHIIYINLHPNYVPSAIINNFTYEDYLKTFVKEVPSDFISFDHYPLVKNEIRSGWYANLELIRKISYQNNLTFWAFACSTIHFNYLQPTISGIKLQQFSNLLYGAQVLQYFTYWTLTYESVWIRDKYGYSIVDDKGNPTPTYDIVKKVNEQIQRLAWVFAGAKSDEVFHTGSEIPEGTRRLYSVPKQFKFFSTYGKNAVVSLMSNGRNKFIIVQNKSLNESIDLEYSLKSALSKVDNATGKTIERSLSKKYIDSILPGDILIFTYSK